MINDTDKLLVNDGNKTETVTFQEFAESLDTGTPPVINTVTLFEDNPTGDRFTYQSFTTTVVMEDDGEPSSNKSIRGTVGSDLKYKFGPIESVNDKQVIYSDSVNFSSPDDNIETPENAFNGNFGTATSGDQNFASTQRVGSETNVRTLQFTFPEPLFVEDGVELVIPIMVSATELQYKINNVEYTASFHVKELYENGNTTVDMPGGLNNEIFYVQQNEINQNIEMYDKYVKPYLVTSGAACKVYYLLRILGPFEFLKFKSLTRKNGTNDTKAKVFGFWLGDHWLNDGLGATELFFDDSQASNIANVKTNDYVVEVGNGDDGVGTVAYTQYIGDALGSTQNKIVLSQIEPNWDAGSDVASPADTTLQYLVLDNDLNVTALQATETDFTPFTGTAPQIKFGPNLGTLGTPDDVLPDGTSIQTEVNASNGIVPDSTKESNLITPGTSVFTPLYLENSEDVIKFNAIKESLDGYQGDRLNFRAELRKRLVENGFTMKDIYNLGLLKNEDATAWSVDTGYNQGSLVSYNDEYWFALSSSYNNSPDDNDPLDWEDLILQ